MGCHCGQPDGFTKVYQLIRAGQPVREFTDRAQAEREKKDGGNRGRIQSVLRRDK